MATVSVLKTPKGTGNEDVTMPQGEIPEPEHAPAASRVKDLVAPLFDGGVEEELGFGRITSITSQKLNKFAKHA
ncbi:hypothetical protein L1987_47348 [Smallanthus sonchifolius]|uniref:Uncharacterized protein n=1 Tax=Smallanthus sonchifolius TaxID=185202 RepID=A0ACB9G262_9ASTR|nr:hypothetical protein L1987_47348 [Smallanthus sonchifolius]